MESNQFTADLVERYQNGDPDLVIRQVEGRYTIISRRESLLREIEGRPPLPMVEDPMPRVRKIVVSHMFGDEARYVEVNNVNDEVEPRGPPARTGPSHYNCCYCPAQFKNSASRYHHIKNVHMKIQIDTCPECNGKHTILDYHIRKRHNACPICLVYLSSEQQVDEHMLMLHHQTIFPNKS